MRSLSAPSLLLRRLHLRLLLRYAFTLVIVVRVAQFVVIVRLVSGSVLASSAAVGVTLLATDRLGVVFVVDALHVGHPMHVLLRLLLRLLLLLRLVTTLNHAGFPTRSTLLLRARKLLFFLSVQFVKIFHKFTGMYLSVRFLTSLLHLHLARMALFSTVSSTGIPWT